MPHEDGNNIFARTVLKWLLVNSSAIIIHSNESYDILKKMNIDLKKVFLVMHPSYINVYPSDNTKCEIEKKAGKINIVFMGAIKPYKNVETIIDVAAKFNDEDIFQFYICGKPQNQEYALELKNRIKSNNITTLFRFIEDDEISALFDVADAILLPYNTKSSLNSGLAILAFSCGKTVITTDIGTVKEKWGNFKNHHRLFGGGRSGRQRCRQRFFLYRGGRSHCG